MELAPKKEGNCNVILIGFVSYGLYVICLYNFDIVFASNQTYILMSFNLTKLLLIFQFYDVKI